MSRSSGSLKWECLLRFFNDSTYEQKVKRHTYSKRRRKKEKNVPYEDSAFTEMKKKTIEKKT